MKVAKGMKAGLSIAVVGTTVILLGIGCSPDKRKAPPGVAGVLSLLGKAQTIFPSFKVDDAANIAFAPKIDDAATTLTKANADAAACAPPPAPPGAAAAEPAQKYKITLKLKLKEVASANHASLNKKDFEFEAPCVAGTSSGPVTTRTKAKGFEEPVAGGAVEVYATIACEAECNNVFAVVHFKTPNSAVTEEMEAEMEVEVEDAALLEDAEETQQVGAVAATGTVGVEAATGTVGADAATGAAAATGTAGAVAATGAPPAPATTDQEALLILQKEGEVYKVKEKFPAPAARPGTEEQQ